MIQQILLFVYTPIKNNKMSTYTPTGFDYNQIIMMTVIPIITTMFSGFFQSISGDIKNLLVYIVILCFSKLTKFFNKYIMKKYDIHNMCYIRMFQSFSGKAQSDVLTSEAIPIIWYVRNNVDVKIAKLIKSGLLPMNNQFPTKDESKNTTLRDNSYGIFNLTSLSENLNAFENVELSDDVFMDIKYLEEAGNSAVQYIILKSNKKTTREIQKFYETIKEKYDTESYKKNGKVFVYNGEMRDDQDFREFSLDKYQTFDNLFFKGKLKLMKELDKLSDPEFYLKHGIKRKICLLITGKPGCGKTAISSAITKYLGRNMVNIPISRIESNREIEDILYQRDILGTVYEMDKLTFLFDEIDSIESKNMLKKKINHDDTDSELSHQEKRSDKTIIISDDKGLNNYGINNKDHDKFNTGIFLNLLDGNIDQENMVIIATANNINNIDPALYREGRLTHIEMEYSGRDEISEMITYYNKLTLTPEQIQLINDSKQIQPIKIRNVCINNIGCESALELIQKINSLFEGIEE